MKKSWKGWTFTAVVFIVSSLFVMFKLDIPSGYVTIIGILEVGITGTGVVKSLKNEN